MKAFHTILSFSFGVLTVSAIVIQTNSTEIESVQSTPYKARCPNYQLKCPDCPSGQQCVYPESGGCGNAGIPICQALNCHGIVCLMKSLPCPDECPFSCRYTGPPCCPFIGEPVCEPVCETFAPCQVTECPEDCPDDCFYPDADFCCPYAGKAVCNKDRLTLTTESLPTITDSIKVQGTQQHGSGYKSGGASEVRGFYNDYRGWSNNDDYHYRPEERYNEYYGYGSAYNPYEGYGYAGNYYGGEYGYQEGNRHRHHREPDHQHHDGSNDCLVCKKTVTDVSVDIEFTTTTRSAGPIICAQYIIPCPDECPRNCVYPTHLPCPFTHQPWCPSVVQPLAEEESCIYNTEGYPIPYFPTYDPYHSIFTSILNNSGVTSTPPYITAEPTTPPSVICPLLFVYCPAECPDTCLRKNVPCPFAEEGYCPGEESSSTITKQSSSSVSVMTQPGVCPLYMLACPYCPEGFSCTRDMTGYCPNTNVPYCVSTATPTALPSGVLFEYYPDAYAPEPTPWYDFNYKLRAMALPSENQEDILEDSNDDACAKMGLTRVDSENILQQILQEKRSDCQQQECPSITFDETCENTCVYFTEDSCCLQVKCISTVST